MPENEKKELIVERLFIEKTEKGDSATPAHSFSSFFDRRIIVLLGDPGSGKTTSFNEAIKEDINAIKLTPGDLALDDLDRYKGAKSPHRLPRRRLASGFGSAGSR